jgi:transcription initiation factor TFIID subunit 5
MVAGGADNGIIHLWDASSGKMIGLYQGHNRGSPVYSVAFNQDSTVLCSGAADSSVRVWDLKEVATSPRTHASVGYPVYQTNNVYHTKYTPVYFVGYTEKNMLYAGGPVNLSSHPVTENSKVQELESLKALNINHTVPL